MTYETVNYKGFDIEINYDDWAQNPFIAWDCEPPILVVSGRDSWEYGLDFYPPDLTRAEIKANLDDIKAFLGFDTLLKAFKDYSYYWQDDAVDILNEMIAEDISNSSNADKLESLAQVYSWKGIEAIIESRNGYSQGNYIDVLAVALPEWIEKVRAPKESITGQLKGAIDLYAAWAFGDVYYFNIDTLDETLGSFYGNDMAENGLLNEAESMIDWHIENARKERINTIKTLIKNHVPLIKRAELLV